MNLSNFHLSVRLIGRIQRTATPSFVQIFGYPVEIIPQCERFLPNKQGIDDGGIYTFCRYYPTYVQLAVVANNPDEQAICAQYLRHNRVRYFALI
ncbi:hypothetical protein [Microcystis aeruginosa]|uniref:hypothetical protein n=1 Tax=Microcystis aeruginosa TaxID=1126 RepID=UPI0007760227|nr:hypothetical protein [Microcystis aeruginosa]KXS91039.1 hypothetical protein OA58_12080 [Microcystis aeruginosa NIES-88]BCU10510.1 hypothetical protein MAN88_10740 [Microcystis aeruginosa]